MQGPYIWGWSRLCNRKNGEKTAAGKINGKFNSNHLNYLLHKIEDLPIANLEDAAA